MNEQTQTEIPDDQVLATATTGELATPGGLAPVRLEGEQPDDILLPTLHIFHDVGGESRDRGEHAKGSALHSLSNEEIATAPKLFADYDFTSL